MEKSKGSICSWKDITYNFGLVYSSHSPTNHARQFQTLAEHNWLLEMPENWFVFSKYINLTFENVTPKPLSSTMTKILHQVTSTEPILPHVCSPSVGSPGMFWVSWSVCLTCLLWWWPTNPINSTWIKYPRNNCLHVHIWWICQTCSNSRLGKRIQLCVSCFTNIEAGPCYTITRCKYYPSVSNFGEARDRSCLEHLCPQGSFSSHSLNLLRVSGKAPW